MQLSKQTKWILIAVAALIVIFIWNGGGQDTSSHTLVVKGEPEASFVPEPEAKEPVIPTCPSKDFYVFFKAFSEDRAVQKAFTKVPLRSETVEDVPDQEPKTVVRFLDQKKITFPIWPLRAERESQSLISKVEDLSESSATVTLFRLDTNAAPKAYTFKKEECWQLESIGNF
jgi:hypothetical protein